jgi:hypothetical protein
MQQGPALNYSTQTLGSPWFSHRTSTIDLRLCLANRSKYKLQISDPHPYGTPNPTPLQMSTEPTAKPNLAKAKPKATRGRKRRTVHPEQPRRRHEQERRRSADERFPLPHKTVLRRAAPAPEQGEESAEGC